MARGELGLSLEGEYLAGFFGGGWSVVLRAATIGFVGLVVVGWAGVLAGGTSGCASASSRDMKLRVLGS